jgi:hypothetical protein
MVKHMPTTEKNLHVSDEVLARLTAEAAAEGRSVDEVADERLLASLRKQERDRLWTEVTEHGRQRGAASGITEDQVVDVVHDYRKRHLGR